MKTYGECIQCGDKSLVGEWNTETRKRFKGKEIISLTRGRVYKHLIYICPVCKEENKGEDVMLSYRVQKDSER